MKYVNVNTHNKKIVQIGFSGICLEQKHRKSNL